MLGRDFLDKNIEYINTKNGAMKFNDESIVTIVRKNVQPTGRQSSDSTRGHFALTLYAFVRIAAGSACATECCLPTGAICSSMPADTNVLS